MSRREGKTIRRIREVVRIGALKEPFTPQDVNSALEITWAGTFLPKHRVGNPGGYTELFVKSDGGYCLVRRGTYDEPPTPSMIELDPEP